MYDDNIQQELFALPINNKLVARVEGTKLYSNDKLKQRYINTIEKSKNTKKVAKEFTRLINDNKIIPCWLSKGLLGFIAYKIFAPMSTKGIMGFFHPDEEKIFILIDNNVKLGIVSDTFISKLSLHESMHMLAHNRPTGFFKLFENELTEWYYYFFIEIFDLDTSKIPRSFKKDLSTPVKFLFQNVEIKMNIDNTVFQKYRKLVYNSCNKYTKLEKQKFEEILDDLINLPRIYYNDFDSFISLLRQYKHIVKPMYKSYKQAFGLRNLSTLCIQELLYPSEIICVLSEDKPSSKVYQGIKKI